MLISSVAVNLNPGPYRVETRRSPPPDGHASPVYPSAVQFGAFGARQRFTIVLVNTLFLKSLKSSRTVISLGSRVAGGPAETDVVSPSTSATSTAPTTGARPSIDERHYLLCDDPATPVPGRCAASRRCEPHSRSPRVGHSSTSSTSRL